MVATPSPPKEPVTTEPVTVGRTPPVQDSSPPPSPPSKALSLPSLPVSPKPASPEPTPQDWFGRNTAVTRSELKAAVRGYQYKFLCHQGKVRVAYTRDWRFKPHPALLAVPQQDVLPLKWSESFWKQASNASFGDSLPVTYFAWWDPRISTEHLHRKAVQFSEDEQALRIRPASIAVICSSQPEKITGTSTAATCSLKRSSGLPTRQSWRHRLQPWERRRGRLSWIPNRPPTLPQVNVWKGERGYHNMLVSTVPGSPTGKRSRIIFLV